jgi:hypothetical protein
MTDETQSKQQYLREQILTLGYNPAHFASYLCRERQDGDDIDNWSFSSLTEVVQKYKKINPDPEAEHDTEYDLSDPSDDENYTDTQTAK